MVPAPYLDGEIAAERASGRPSEAFALALTAADLAGTARGALDDALEHARGRRQFSRPVGSFQAVAHLAADAAVD
ncbi:MAG: acyl-CoA dehydrogenase, partial [Streptomycetaceae bacterium]|nr:acyl-CoA dehydrogenase [Streptomycetaceae bacterium]